MKIYLKQIKQKIIQYKFFLILLLLASLSISIVSILHYNFFIFRGIPAEEFSVFSKAFAGSAIQCFLLWMYVILILCFLTALACFLFRAAKKFFLDIKSRSVPPKTLLSCFAAAAVLVGITFAAEYICGHLIAGGPTSTGSYFNRYYFLFLLCAFFTIYFIVLYIRKIIIKFEALFLALMLIIGCCYSFGLPLSNVSWDESVHYNRTLSASKLADCSMTEAERQVVENEISLTYNIEEIDHKKQELNGSRDVAVPGIHIYRYEFYEYMSYLPSGVVMGICRLLHFSFYFTYRMGRFTNLFMYALLIYFAMKRLKSGKAILAVIAAFPLNFFVAASYSYDWFLTGMCILGFSYIIAELQTPTEKITGKSACIIILAFFFGIGTKAIYFPMMLLSLLLPPQKFSSRKAHRLFQAAVGVTTLLAVISFALPFIASSGASGTDTRGGSNVNAMEQIKYVFAHPITYARTLFRFLTQDMLSFQESAGYTCHFGYLGHAKFSTSVMMLLTAACFTDHDTFDRSVLTKKFRLVTLIICGITLVLFASAMYAAFTDVGADTINGCTQRYLEPLIFPAVFCIGSGKISSGVSRRFHYAAFSVGIGFILLASIWQMCIGSYC